MSSLTDRQFNLAQAVQAHAVANYDRDGWDTIVECYGLGEIAELLGKARTVAGAIRKVAAVIRDRHGVAESAGRSEAQAELAAGYADMAADRAARRPALEPDGSRLTIRTYPDGDISSVTRTWPGRVGSSSIDLDTNDETYTPGWRGQTLRSANYCNHDEAQAARGGLGGVCWTDGCRRPDCIPF